MEIDGATATVVQDHDTANPQTLEVGVNWAPVPPVTQAQYQAKIAELNSAIQDQNLWEGSLINLLRAMINLGDLRSEKDAQLTAEQAKPAAQQNAQLIAQLQADIAAIDGQRAAYGREYGAERVKSDAAHAQAVSLRATADSMADALLARGITPSPATIPEVPDTKTDAQLLVIANGG
jgi:chromosome segregation ATPase